MRELLEHRQKLAEVIAQTQCAFTRGELDRKMTDLDKLIEKQIDVNARKQTAESKE